MHAPESPHVPQKRASARAKRHRAVREQPRRQPAKVPFCADVRPDADDGEEIQLLRHVQEFGQIFRGGVEIYFSGRSLMEVPRHVQLHGVEPKRAGSFQAVKPEGRRDPVVVDFPRKDPHRLFVEVEAVVFQSEGAGEAGGEKAESVEECDGDIDGSRKGR